MKQIMTFEIFMQQKMSTKYVKQNIFHERPITAIIARVTIIDSVANEKKEIIY